MFTFIIIVRIYYCCSYLLLSFTFIIVVLVIFFIHNIGSYYCSHHYYCYCFIIHSVKEKIESLFLSGRMKRSRSESQSESQSDSLPTRQSKYSNRFHFDIFFMIIIYISLLYYAFTITLYVVAIIKFFHSCTIYILWWLLFIYHRFETHDTSRRVQTCVRIESEMWLNDALLPSTHNFQFTSSVIETIHNQTNQCVRYITPFIQINSVSISYLDTNVHST